jgi:ABC-type Fe3+ transport system substrate-binding protein
VSKFRSKRLGLVALLTVLMLMAAACGSSSDTKTTSGETTTTGASNSSAAMNAAMDKLYKDALANGEKEVRVGYVPLQSFIPDWKPLFEKRFPGLTLTPRDFGTNSAWGSLVLQELNSGQRTVDTGITSALVYKPLVDAGKVDNVDWAALGASPDRVQAPIPGLLINHDIACGITIYDSRKWKASDLPTDPQGWLDPKWKNQMAVEPFNGFACMAWYGLKVGEDKALALGKAMKDQNGLLVVDSAENLLASGERSVIPFHATRGLALKDKGVPVAGKFLAATGGIARQGFAVIKGTPSPNATRLFSLWSTTDEAQSVSEKVLGGAYSFVGPSRPNSPLRQEIIHEGLNPDDPNFFTYENADNWVARSDLATRLRTALTG